MSDVSLTLAPGAVEDARDARLHYRDINARLANDFMAKLDLAIDRILENPRSWPRWSNDVHRYFMQRFPYAVVYRVQPNKILVLAVAHLHRRPGYWTRR